MVTNVRALWTRCRLGCPLTKAQDVRGASSHTYVMTERHASGPGPANGHSPGHNAGHSIGQRSPRSVNNVGQRSPRAGRGQYAAIMPQDRPSRGGDAGENFV